MGFEGNWATLSGNLFQGMKKTERINFIIKDKDIHEIYKFQMNSDSECSRYILVEAALTWAECSNIGEELYERISTNL